MRGRSEQLLSHHENAPAHSAVSIREFLVDKQIPVIPYPSRFIYFQMLKLTSK